MYISKFTKLYWQGNVCKIHPQHINMIIESELVLAGMKQINCDSDDVTLWIWMINECCDFVEERERNISGEDNEEFI